MFRSFGKEIAMSRRISVLALFLALAGCKNMEHSGSVTVVIQTSDDCRHSRTHDTYRHTSFKPDLKPEVRIEYKIKGQAPDEDHSDR